MKVDTEALRQHYESLSDDALLEINRDELVPEAQACLDAEILHRGLTGSQEDYSAESEVALDGGTETDWEGEGAPAITVGSAADAGDAREFLERAGIPCEIEEHEHQYSLIVPHKFNLLAASVLEKEIFNAELEQGYRAHFAALSDDELRETNVDQLLIGVKDRIERLKRSYQDELARRGL